MIMIPERNLRVMNTLFAAYEPFRRLALADRDRDGSVLRLHTNVNKCFSACCNALDDTGGRR